MDNGYYWGVKTLLTHVCKSNHVVFFGEVDLNHFETSVGYLQQYIKLFMWRLFKKAITGLTVAVGYV